MTNNQASITKQGQNFKIKNSKHKFGIWNLEFGISRLGFTLIELMVAMAIVAILVVAGYASYIRSQRRALDARRQGDMKAFQTAMEQRYSIDGDYPDSDNEAKTEFAGGSLPKDPINNSEYFYVYEYADPESGGDGYCACAKLVTFTGNSGPSCDFADADKLYFCTRNLQ